MPEIKTAEIQALHDIEVVTQLADACPAMRRYLSHHIRNDLQRLLLAQINDDWSMVDEYISLTVSRLEMVKL